MAAAVALLALASCMGAEAASRAAPLNGLYFPTSCAARCASTANYQQPLPDVPNPNKGTRANQWSELLLVLVGAQPHCRRASACAAGALPWARPGPAVHACTWPPSDGPDPPPLGARRSGRTSSSSAPPSWRGSWRCTARACTTRWPRCRASGTLSTPSRTASGRWVSCRPAARLARLAGSRQPALAWLLPEAGPGALLPVRATQARRSASPATRRLACRLDHQEPPERAGDGRRLHAHHLHLSPKQDGSRRLPLRHQRLCHRRGRVQPGRRRLPHGAHVAPE
jgi:hypothetical protein